MNNKMFEEAARSILGPTAQSGRCRARIGTRALALLFRYLRFGLVGTVGIAIDMLALFVFADEKMLHVDLSLSKALAAEIALMSNFIGNEIWTFRDLAIENASWRGRMSRFFRFNIICVVGIGLSVLLLNVQTRSLQWNMYASNLISIIAVSMWNFGMNLKFGWKPSGCSANVL
jgi:dolichol-phosphate mannosyltransferase